MKFVISPASFYLIPLRSKYSPHQRVLKTSSVIRNMEILSAETCNLMFTNRESTPNRLVSAILDFHGLFNDVFNVETL
jgi:hypothetical protein